MFSLKTLKLGQSVLLMAKYNQIMKLSYGGGYICYIFFDDSKDVAKAIFTGPGNFKAGEFKLNNSQSVRWYPTIFQEFKDILEQVGFKTTIDSRDIKVEDLRK